MAGTYFGVDPQNVRNRLYDDHNARVEHADIAHPSDCEGVGRKLFKVGKLLRSPGQFGGEVNRIACVDAQAFHPLQKQPLSFTLAILMKTAK